MRALQARIAERGHMRRHNATVTQLLLACTALALCGCGGETVSLRMTELRAPDDPALLLRISFDESVERADTAAGDPAMTPTATDTESQTKRGRLTEQGRLGQALQMNLGRMHRFRALGNLSARQGTVAFWLRFDRALPGSHATVLDLGQTFMQNREAVPISLRIRNRRVVLRVGATEQAVESIPGAVGQWHHIAIVYDCFRGVKLYVNGQAQPESRWGKPENGWFSGGAWMDLIQFATDSFGGTATPMSFDEFRAYSRALGPNALASLARGEEPANPLDTEPERGVALFRKQRLAELGWGKAGEYPAVTVAKPVRISEVPVKDALDHKTFRWAVADGLPGTRWPTTYHGYGIPTGGLHLSLEEGRRINYVVLEGNFTGGLYAGADLIKPARTEALWACAEASAIVRALLREPIPSGEISLFRDQAKQHINELGLYEIGTDAPAEADRSVAYYLSDVPFEPSDRWVKWGLFSHYESQDRGSSELAMSTGELAVLRLRALRHHHFFVPAREDGESPNLVSAIRFHLQTDAIRTDTRLRVTIVDPVDVSRRKIGMDVRLGRGPAGTREFVLDPADFVIPPGRTVWLIVTPERDLRLRIGGSGDASRVEIIAGDRVAGVMEDVRETLNYAKDRFIHVSEPRPWGKVSMDDLAERMLAFRQLNMALRHLKALAPDNEKVQALWTWTHPRESPDAWKNMAAPPADGAPPWAVYAKEAMKKYRAFALWWIENRQIHSGVFGSGYGDDTDLINDWLSVGMICDPGGRIRDSARRLADYCWNEGPMAKGINRRLTDTLHAYEEGLNAQLVAAALHYGDPCYLERLMEASRTVRDHLTYTTPDGRRFFKSCWYSATRVDTEWERGRDIPTNALFMHPALYLSFYSRNEGAVRLVREWVGAWCGLIEEARAAKKPLPTAVRFPTAEVSQTTDQLPTGYGFGDACLAGYTLTGEEKYFSFLRTWLDAGNVYHATTADWAAVRDMSEWHALIKEMAATRLSWHYLSPQMADDARCNLAYLAWQATGDKAHIVKALESSWKKIVFLFPMHTWVEQSADRVMVSKTLVDRLYLGGTPGFRNKIWPTHTVSWSGLNEEFAAWVLTSTPERLRVWIYNFDPQPQSGVMRVLGLENGIYDVCMGEDVDQDEIIDAAPVARTLSLARNSAIPLTLPSRRAILLEITQKTKGPSFWERPDLAVVTTDMSYDGESGTLGYVVHNVGTRSAEKAVVRVEADGVEIARHVIDAIDAPIDLAPRRVELTQRLPAGTKNVVVTADPDEKIEEIFEENNAAAFAVSRQQ